MINIDQIMNENKELSKELQAVKENNTVLKTINDAKVKFLEFTKNDFLYLIELVSTESKKNLADMYLLNLEGKLKLCIREIDENQTNLTEETK